MLVLFLLLLQLSPAEQKAEAARAANRPEAVSLYREALKANPRWTEGWWAAGTLEYQQDRYAECRDSFARLTTLEPKGGVGWTMWGLCEFGSKEYDPALTHLRKGQELGVGVPAINEVARYHLAQLYTQAGNFEQAMGIFVDMAQSSTEKPAFLMASGLAALWKPLLPDQVPPTDRELVFAAGKAFWNAAARKSETAHKDFEELVRKYPDSPGVHYLAGSYALQDNPDTAVAEFERELKISPRHIGALTALAAEYLRRGEPDKGLPYAREAVAVLPNGVASHALLGRLLAEKGELPEALRELEEAKKIGPDDPQPRIALASLYAKLGRADDAARERREFLRLKEPAKLVK